MRKGGAGSCLTWHWYRLVRLWKSPKPINGRRRGSENMEPEALGWGQEHVRIRTGKESSAGHRPTLRGLTPIRRSGGHQNESKSAIPTGPAHGVSRSPTGILIRPARELASPGTGSRGPPWAGFARAPPDSLAWDGEGTFRREREDRTRRRRPESRIRRQLKGLGLRGSGPWARRHSAPFGVSRRMRLASFADGPEPGTHIVRASREGRSDTGLKRTIRGRQ